MNDSSVLIDRIKKVIAGENGNAVAEALVNVLADILILYCDEYDSDIDMMTGSIAKEITEAIKVKKNMRSN